MKPQQSPDSSICIFARSCTSSATFAAFCFDRGGNIMQNLHDLNPTPRPHRIGPCTWASRTKKPTRESESSNARHLGRSAARVSLSRESEMRCRGLSALGRGSVDLVTIARPQPSRRRNHRATATIPPSQSSPSQPKSRWLRELVAASGATSHPLSSSISSYPPFAGNPSSNRRRTLPIPSWRWSPFASFPPETRAIWTGRDPVL